MAESGFEPRKPDRSHYCPPEKQRAGEMGCTFNVLPWASFAGFRRPARRLAQALGALWVHHHLCLAPSSGARAAMHPAAYACPSLVLASALNARR